MSSRPAATGLLTAAAAAFLLTSCGDRDQDQTAYCVDKVTNEVVDNSECDDDGSHGGSYGGSHSVFVYGAGSSGLHRGSVLPDGPRAAVNDPAGRESLGIARTGSVGSKGGFGSTVKSSGSSSHGSSSHGGFGSSGHGSSGG
jgi:hypothetical protein